MILVIVESPAKCSKIESILGSSYKCMASYGHIRDIPENIKWFKATSCPPSTIPYRVLPSKQKVIDQLQHWSRKSSEVIIATDLDREGEAIAYHLMEVLHLDPRKTKRIVFHEITQESIQKAIQEPITLRQRLYESQLTRRMIDILFGFSLSPLLWKTMKSYHNLSAGRCQSPCLSLLQQQEKIYEESVVQKQWKGTSTMILGKSTCVELRLHKPDCSHYSKVDIEHFMMKELRPVSSWMVYAKREEKKTVVPSTLFITSSLQRTCFQLWKWNPTKTLSIAQKLYEKGRITYMRTDSYSISETFIQDAKQYIAQEFGEDHVNHDQEGRRMFSSPKRTAQEAHECIRPTHVRDLPKKCTTEESRLYDLIWKTSVAHCMHNGIDCITRYQIGPADHPGDEDRVSDIQWEYYECTVLVSGFRVLSDTLRKKNNPITMIVGDTRLSPNTFEFIESVSQSERPCNASDVIKLLEEKGIGRPSTFNSILAKLEEKEYISCNQWDPRVIPVSRLSMEDKGLKNSAILKQEETSHTVNPEIRQCYRLTEKGNFVCTFLQDHFHDLVNPFFTQDLESTLDNICNGERFYWDVICEFYHTIQKKISNYHPNPLVIPSAVPKTTVLDTLEGEPIVKKYGKFGCYVTWKSYQQKYDSSTMTLPNLKQKLLEKTKEFIRPLNDLISIRRKNDQSPFYLMYFKWKKSSPVFISFTSTLLREYDPLTMTLSQAQHIVSRHAQ